MVRWARCGRVESGIVFTNCNMARGMVMAVVNYKMVCRKICDLAGVEIKNKANKTKRRCRNWYKPCSLHAHI